MKRSATPMVGGLVSSTVLTLVAIPAAYVLVQRRRLRKKIVAAQSHLQVHREPTTV